MKTKLLLVLMASVFTIGLNAQIKVGNIKTPKVKKTSSDIKNKKKDIENKKNNAENKKNDIKNKKNELENKKNNSNATPAIGKYEKAMKAARAAEEKKDYITAYKEYSKALKEKNNDYSATNGLQMVKSDAVEQYELKLTEHLSRGDCDSFKSTIDDLTETISMTPSEKENWLAQKSECEKLMEEEKAGAEAKENAKKYNSMANGSYFESGFHTLDNHKTVNIGDELWMNIKMGKTMMEYSQDFGIDETFNAYGFFVIYMDGKKVATTKPLHFGSNYSKKWTNFDVPLSINPELGEDKNALEKLMETSQGMWVVSNLQNADLINKVYVLEAIKNMAPKNGKHQLKIEFGLGEKTDKAPKGIISTGEVTIIVDETGSKKLYEKGPKYMRPLSQNEMGNITVDNNNFILGKSNLTATVKLPHPPKYYAMKWCTTMSCDYDHGNLFIKITIDGIELSSRPALWNEDWETKKDFTLTIIPKNDNELDNSEASFSKEGFYAYRGEYNNIVYGLIDLIYSGKIKAGNHKINISLLKDVVVGNDTHYNKIAENNFNLNLSQSQINSFVATSNAKKLSHAGGSWTSVDNHLKSKYNTDRVVDVACNTEWKVTRNSLGVILYRTCKADVLYKSEDGGYRIMQSVEVKEDYNGSSYGKPYFVGHFRTDWGSNNLNNMHFPVPATKVK